MNLLAKLSAGNIIIVIQNMRKIKLLIVGQTPPPYGGQAMMIERLVKAKYENIELEYVRMDFSSEMRDIGKFQVKKVFHLFEVIYEVFCVKIKKDIDFLYYPPAGANKVPMYRDLMILCCVRWLFKKTVFHFHAIGISQLYDDLDSISKFFFRKAYYYPDLAINIIENKLGDDEKLKSKQSTLVLNGIEDEFKTINQFYKENQNVPSILYLNILKKEKGVLVLLRALALLKRSGVCFKMTFAGEFESHKFKEEVLKTVRHLNLIENIEFVGVVTGREKWTLYAKSDVFCLPSEWESFGLVVIEAMQFKLPVVITNWSGADSIVEDGKSGYIVPIGSEKSIASKLKILIENYKMQVEMGEQARKIFLKKYTIEKFRSNMERVMRTYL